MGEIYLPELLSVHVQHCLLLFLTLIAIVVIGVTLGLFAGYKKGWIERLVLRFIDVGLSIPEFIIMIALGFLRRSLWNFVYLNYINKMDELHKVD